MSKELNNANPVAVRTTSSKIVFKISVSFDGCESLPSLPNFLSHFESNFLKF
jgi:hypothetical protein